MLRLHVPSPSISPRKESSAWSLQWYFFSVALEGVAWFPPLNAKQNTFTSTPGLTLNLAHFDDYTNACLGLWPFDTSFQLCTINSLSLIRLDRLFLRGPFGRMLDGTRVIRGSRRKLTLGHHFFICQALTSVVLKVANIAEGLASGFPAFPAPVFFLLSLCYGR